MKKSATFLKGICFLFIASIIFPNFSYGIEVELHPQNMLAMTYEELNYQLTTSTWKDPSSWRTRYKGDPFGEKKTRLENINKLISGQAEFICRQTNCGESKCKTLIEEHHEFRLTSTDSLWLEPAIRLKNNEEKEGSPSSFIEEVHTITRRPHKEPKKEYYFTYIKCSSQEHPDPIDDIYPIEIIHTLPAIQEEAQMSPPEACSTSVIPSQQNKTHSHLLKTDYSIASLLIEEFYKENRDINFEVEKFGSIQQGLKHYLSDRRHRQKSLSPEELISLVFSKSSTHTHHHLTLPSAEWFASFGNRETEKKDLNSHLEKSNKILEQSLPQFPLKFGTKIKLGSSSIVYHVNLSEYPADSSKLKEDFSDYYFKFPSPLKTQPSREGYHIKVLSEVVAYRLNQLLGFDTVDETIFMTTTRNDEKLLGTARRAVGSQTKETYALVPPHNLLSEMNNPGKWRPTVSRLRVLDYLMTAQDRHNDNMLYNSSNYSIHGIDYEGILLGLPAANPTHPISGGRFPISYDDPINPKSTKSIRDRLLEIDYHTLQSHLSDIATDEDIENIWLRLKIIQADILQRSALN